jgi:hypothetical protein
MHVIARGALIGAGVGAALAVLRGGGESEPGGGAGGRYAKSIAEGAVAGAAVGFLLDRRLRARATTLIAARAPELAETIADVAGDVYETARPRVVELAVVARERAEQAYEAARPRVLELAEVARERASDFRSA